jgi:XTP/dITP diphosphohydrolase
LSAPAARARELFPEIKLLIATQNPGKLREITALLADLPLAVLSPSALDRPLPPVSEDGLTYEANARVKADSACRATGLAVLADDSGLEVTGLGGAPGVHSARFAGPTATDAENNALLLARLAGAPEAARRARFVCTAVLLLPSGLVRVTTGAVEGRIADAERGEQGFGYDPLFFYPPFGCTFGEAGAADKESVSHRGAAFRAMAAEIRSLLAVGASASPA